MRFPAGRSSTSTPASSASCASSPSVSGIDELQAALAAREERRRHLLEVPRDRLERLVEAALDGLCELVTELRDLRERRLEILPLRCELVEALLLRLVLLLRQRVDLAELLASRVESLGAGRELGPIVALGGLVRARGVETTCCLLGLGLETCEVDLHGRRPLVRLVRLPARLDLGRTEPAKLLPEEGGPLRARVDPRLDRRLESRRNPHGPIEARAEHFDGVAQPNEHVGIERRPARPPLEQRSVGRARTVGCLPCELCGRIRQREQRRSLGLELLSAGGVVCRAQVDGAAEPDDDDFGGLGSRDRVGRVASSVCLEPREASQFGAEISRLLRAERLSRGDWLLERSCRVPGTAEGRFQPGNDLHERAEECRIDIALAEMRDAGKCLLCGRSSRRRLGSRVLCCRCAAGELRGLVGECPAAGIHLEQHRLGSLTGEPELAPFRVVAVPLRRDRGAVRRVEQLLGVDEPEPVQKSKRRFVSGHERYERLRSRDRRGVAAAPSRSTSTVRLPSPSRRVCSSRARP